MEQKVGEEKPSASCRTGSLLVTVFNEARFEQETQIETVPAAPSSLLICPLLLSEEILHVSPADLPLRPLVHLGIGG